MLSVTPVREDRSSVFVTLYAGLGVGKNKCRYAFSMASAVSRACIGGSGDTSSSFDYICEVNLPPEFMIIGVCFSGVPLRLTTSSLDPSCLKTN